VPLEGPSVTADFEVAARAYMAAGAAQGNNADEEDDDDDDNNSISDKDYVLPTGMCGSVSFEVGLAQIIAQCGPPLPRSPPPLPPLRRRPRVLALLRSRPR
jgi:hypothetical protein